MTPVLSIIVPVYNTEKFISRCINSILTQEYPDFELLLVDDCSTDTSGKICDAFALKDNRIRVIHLEKNQGVSAARNIALRLIQGKYISFVDSDDTVSADLYKNNILHFLDDPTLDIIQFRFFLYYGNDKQYLTTIYPEHTFGPMDFFLKWSNNCKSFGGQVCNKIFKSSLWHDIKFPYGIIDCEDLYIMPQLISKVKHAYFSDIGIYFYYNNEESATQKRKTYRRAYSHLQASFHACEAFMQYPIKENFKIGIKHSLINGYLTMKFAMPDEDFSIYCQKIRKYKWTWNDIATSCLSNKEKFKMTIIKLIGIQLFEFIYYRFFTLFKKTCKS